jgi:hypothetical protein
VRKVFVVLAVLWFSAWFREASSSRCAPVATTANS